MSIGTQASEGLRHENHDMVLLQSAQAILPFLP